MAKHGYETAVICHNGHIITSSTEASPEKASPYCIQCGAPTTDLCEYCHKKIRGRHNSPQYAKILYRVPAYCHNCGNPYPWTESKFAAAKELLKEVKTLKMPEKKMFARNLEQISHDSPQAQAAAVHVNKFIAKVEKDIAGALRQLAFDVASAKAKKILK